MSLTSSDQTPNASVTASIPESPRAELACTPNDRHAHDKYTSKTERKTYRDVVYSL